MFWKERPPLTPLERRMGVIWWIVCGANMIIVLLLTAYFVGVESVK